MFSFYICNIMSDFGLFIKYSYNLNDFKAYKKTNQI